MAKFINLEGLDSSGKSSQIKLITEYFQKQNKKVKFIHFPMYGHNMYSEMISKFLRGEYGSNDEVDPIFVANIYAMDRYMYKNQLMRDLEEYDIVVMDRYVFSNIAYQGAKTKSDDEMKDIYDEIFHFEFEFLQLPYPDMIIFFDVPISEIERRLNLERTGTDRDYLNGKKDIHEQDISYQDKVRDIYLFMKDEGIKNFFVIPAYNEQGILPPIELFNTYKNQL
jgi:dTMP kinase